MRNRPLLHFWTYASLKYSLKKKMFSFGFHFWSIFCHFLIYLNKMFDVTYWLKSRYICCLCMIVLWSFLWRKSFFDAFFEFQRNEIWVTCISIHQIFWKSCLRGYFCPFSHLYIRFSIAWKLLCSFYWPCKCRHRRIIWRKVRKLWPLSIASESSEWNSTVPCCTISSNMQSIYDLYVQTAKVSVALVCTLL